MGPKMTEWLNEFMIKNLSESSEELLQAMTDAPDSQKVFMKMQPYVRDLVLETRTFIGGMHRAKDFPAEFKKDFEICEKVLNSVIQGNEMMYQMVKNLEERLQ